LEFGRARSEKNQVIISDVCCRTKPAITLQFSLDKMQQKAIYEFMVRKVDRLDISPVILFYT
jgi:hypothetical protein